MTWNIYWAAGGHSAQPLYDQFDYGGCAVGCGPVAWTMLFCWGDYQAGHGNAYWAPRLGLYRENGGYGVVVVPKGKLHIGLIVSRCEQNPGDPRK